MSVSGLTTVRTRRQSISRDSATTAMRVASSARRGLTFRSRYNANCLRRNRFLGGELGAWAQHRRHESENVTRDAQDRADVETTTGLGHAADVTAAYGSS